MEICVFGEGKMGCVSDEATVGFGCRRPGLQYGNPHPLWDKVPKWDIDNGWMNGKKALIDGLLRMCIY